METEKIGMREFRENLAGYLEAGRPLAITRHGETLGFFIPAQKKSRKAEVEAMRAAARELDTMIAAWGASEDELMQEYKEIRRTSREKKRNAGESAGAGRQHSDSRGTWAARSPHSRVSRRYHFILHSRDSVRGSRGTSGRTGR